MIIYKYFWFVKECSSQGTPATRDSVCHLDRPIRTGEIPSGIWYNHQKTNPGKIMSKTYYVYILTNKRHTVFYTGITNNLERRVWEHKQKIIQGFTKKYNIEKLVYFEVFEDVLEAIRREKQIKGWVRRRKIALIEKMNPEWKDLSEYLSS